MKLIVENLAQSRGGRTLFARLSLTVAAGEALVLTGPNGAGKTTLLRTLAGFLAPEAGSIRLQGAPADTTVGEWAHYVGHLNAIKPALSVRENVTFWSAYLGAGAADATARALQRLQLDALADIPAGYLSAGQKRRLGLARLLAADRPLWLLDEPTVSLDADNRDRLAAIIQDHLAAGGLVVAATHLPLGLARAKELDLTDPARAA